MLVQMLGTYLPQWQQTGAFEFVETFSPWAKIFTNMSYVSSTIQSSSLSYHGTFSSCKRFMIMRMALDSMLNEADTSLFHHLRQSPFWQRRRWCLVSTCRSASRPHPSFRLGLLSVLDEQHGHTWLVIASFTVMVSNSRS